MFVGNPGVAPPSSEFVYARPDDVSDRGTSWRDELCAYNADPQGNPLRLLPAAKLYTNPIYSRLEDRFGADQMFILSAGWGLIKASFLTPMYDITFTKAADPYKQRSRKDVCNDFRMLSDNTDEQIVFFGGKDYVPLFCQLTSGVQCERKVYCNSERAPEAFGCSIERFNTSTRTNWHYECANAFLDRRTQ